MVTVYGSYEEAAQDYLARFRALREAPSVPTDVVTRAAGDIPAETLIDRADEIADVSARMVPLSREYLQAPDMTLRQGITGQLIAQAAAELQLATELVHIAQIEGAGPPGPATRAVHSTALQEAIDAMEASMVTPAAQGLVSSVGVARAAVPVPATLGDAKDALRRAATTSAGSIVQHVCEFGGDVAWDLAFNTRWMAVIDGATLLRKDIAEKLEPVKEGVSALVSRAVKAASRTLLNVYDKIMALLGKDAEDQARQKVREWLEKIREKEEIDLFDVLVGRLYRVEALQVDVERWLAGTTAGLDVIHETTYAVRALQDQFIVLVGRMRMLEDVVGLAKLIKLPQMLLIVAAVQIGLLAALVYAGLDYVGYRAPLFPNIAKGVGEVIEESLVWGTAADEGESEALVEERLDELPFDYEEPV
jgi:hypothetical protein